ncbi:MAG: tyrosine-type recombinase/integrase [Thermoanaerobaculia bacterium]
MPRGQRVGWKLAQQVPKEAPAVRKKVATGVWMTPHGTFDTFVYHHGKSVFVGAFPSVEDAVQAREKRIADLQGGAAVVDRSASRVSFSSFVEETFFLEAMVGRKDSTIRTARSRYHQHLKPALGDWPLRDITYERLSRLRATLLERRVSGQTKRESLLLLRSILQEAVKRGILAQNPAVHLDLPAKRSNPVSVPVYDLACRAVGAITAPGPRAAAHVLLLTGMRLNECLSLRWDDIELEGHRITVSRSIDQVTGKLVEPKTERAKRRIVIPEALAQLLRVYRALQEAGEAPRADPWVFPSSRSAKDGTERPPVMNDRNFVQRHWAPALRTVPGADFTPHALRHLYASRLLTQGAPVAFAADQLGHSSPAFTYRQYVHFLADRPDQAAAYVNNAFGGAKPAPAGVPLRRRKSLGHP